jgi:hypothetical protein
MCVLGDPQGAVFSVFHPAGGDGPVGRGVFVWDELVTTDVDAAKTFYHEVLGWEPADIDMAMGTYTMFRRAGAVDAAGAMTKPDQMPGPAAWIVYIATDNVDGTVARAVELGAAAVLDGMDIPDVGRIAIVLDPMGGAFGLFQPAS